VKIGDKDVNVMDIMKDAINAKYSLVRYYYTYMWLLSTDIAPELVEGSFYKPLFFEYPNDPQAYAANPSENVMLGPSLKLSVRTSALNASRPLDGHDYYFPQGHWCDVMHPTTQCLGRPGEGVVADLPANLNDFQVHLRAGHIVPMQNASAVAKLNTTDDLRQVKVDFHIHPLNKTKTNKTVIFEASGVYLNDDGESPDSVSSGRFNLYKVKFTYNDVVNDLSNDEYIRLEISANYLASPVYSNETKCAKINENDILGNLYFYDPAPQEAGQSMFQHSKYFVELVRPDQSFDTIGLLKLDPDTDRMVYSWEEGLAHDEAAGRICLNYIQEIRFRPSIM
jgi:Glycosyl hydrolases family 31